MDSNRKNKIFLIIVLCVLLLAGGGLAYFKFFKEDVVIDPISETKSTETKDAKTIDTEMLSQPKFKSLREITIQEKEHNVGNRNPFEIYD